MKKGEAESDIDNSGNVSTVKQYDPNIDKYVDILTRTERLIVSFFLSREGEPVTVQDLRNHIINLIYQEHKSELPEDFEVEVATTSMMMFSTSFTKWLEKKLREKLPALEFPSYLKIESNLKNLMNMDILTTRTDNRGNVSCLWMINPEFRSKWVARRRDILFHIESVLNVSIRAHLYEQNVLDFYNLSLSITLNQSSGAYSASHPVITSVKNTHK